MVTRKKRRKDAGVAMRRAGAMLAGPYVAPPGSSHEGATNDAALAAIVEALGRPPQRGSLYRVTMGQAQPDGTAKPASFIGEFVGMGIDRASGHPEKALGFVIVNPVLPAASTYGTRDNPFVLWPLDVLHISLASPADLDVPMEFRIAGESAIRAPGRPRIQ